MEILWEVSCTNYFYADFQAKRLTIDGAYLTCSVPLASLSRASEPRPEDWKVLGKLSEDIMLQLKRLLAEQFMPLTPAQPEILTPDAFPQYCRARLDGTEHGIELYSHHDPSSQGVIQQITHFIQQNLLSQPFQKEDHL